MRVVLDTNVLLSALIGSDDQQPPAHHRTDRLPDDITADDPDDAFLLAMAVAGDADYLVTGDHRAGLLQQGHIGRARIVTPALFRDEVL